MNRIILSSVLSVVLAATLSAANDWYVNPDPALGNDAWDGSQPTNDVGTLKGPKRTLAGAMAIEGLARYDTVHAARGIYNEGEIWGGNCSNRVVISLKDVGLVADEGKDVTVIEGAPDLRESDDGGKITNKCGSASVRGVYISGSGSYVRGFTIRNCYTGRENGGSNAYGTGGGGYGGAYIDCCITNCVAGYRGAGTYNATLINCWVGTSAGGSYSIYTSSAYNCVIVGAFNGKGPYLNCTMSDGGQGNSSGVASHANYFNCYVYSPKKWSAFHRCYHVGVTNSTSTSAYEDGCRQITTGEANLESGTYRPLRGSVLIDAGSDAIYEEEYNATYKATFGQYDYLFDKRRRGSSIDIGAYEYVWSADDLRVTLSESEFLTVTAASEDAYAKDGVVKLPAGNSLSCAWENPSGEGEPSVISFTAAVSGGATLKVYLNGAEDPAWTLTAADGTKTVSYSTTTADALRFVSEGTEGEVALSAFTTTAHRAFYVDADHGDDGNDGTTLAKARKTLAEAMRIEGLKSGDFVYAAQGTYDEKVSDVVTGSAQSNTQNRVRMPAGVTLKSIRGAKRTIIKGASSTHEHASENGNGTNAVRCVYFDGTGAKIIGFTLTGGRTAPGTNAGAAYGNGYLIDCIVTNNMTAYRGGAIAYGPTCIRCRFIRNYAEDNASVGFAGCVCYDCYFARNTKGSSTANPFYASSSSADSHPRLYNCTFVEGNGQAGVRGAADCYNCLFRGNLTGGANKTLAYFYNCCFASAPSATELSVLTDCRVVGLDALPIDSDGRPLPGNVAIDFGSNLVYKANYPLDDEVLRDYLGSQRIYNKVIDVGCCEYDWRGDFSKKLGLRRFAITEAGEDVTTNVIAGIDVPANESIVADWECKSGKLTFTAAVAGGGSVTVTLDGETVRTLTAADSGEITIAASVGPHVVGFACDGNASVTLSSFADAMGMFLLLR